MHSLLGKISLSVICKCIIIRNTYFNKSELLISQLNNLKIEN